MNIAKPSKRSSTVMVADNQLPIWPNELRALPNSLARSALFSVANVRKGERENRKRHVVAALKGIEILYTGEELRQDDEDVFLQIVHMARLQPLGTPVMFTASAMISTLGWSRNTKSYTRLVDTIDRLKANALSVSSDNGLGKKELYSGSLIRSFGWKETTSGASLREWFIELDEKILGLFNPDGYTHLGWSLRLRLPPLAKWLHSFYHSHREPYGIKVETLRNLTGSEIKQLYIFRFKLKEALGLLCSEGFLTSARIDERTDQVIVERAALHGGAPLLQ
jgi:hypothetical protein